MLTSFQAMKLYAVVVILGVVATSLSSAIPKEKKAHERVKEKADPQHLSDEDHWTGEEDDEHNFDYDHEVFLGKDEAKHFEDLPAEESKRRLGDIYNKIDNDGDKLVTEKELKEWIQHVQNRYTEEDTDRQWADQKIDRETGLLDWEAYKDHTYGYLEHEPPSDEEDYADMLNRDKRRFELADENKDGKLTKREFSDFLHPEDVERMRDIVIEETMEDIDKNKDKKISLEEYIEDMWPSSEADGEEEPDWVKTEREQFTQFRDKNKDNFMDRAEVAEWILPPDYDHTEAEAKHLIAESDEDGDKMLTKLEVLAKYDLFVGSQATDFGEALTRHDEF